MNASTLLLILALFAAVCLWQILAGLGRMRRARANPQDQNAPLLARTGKLQVIAGGAMLALNILLNLPALSALF